MACHNLNEDEKELCIIDLVKKTGFKEGCDELSSKAKERCLLADKKEINNKENKEDDGNNRDEEENTFNIGFDCPIPAGAKHEVGSYKDVWKNDKGQIVGPYLRYYDYKREIIASASCYNNENQGHGVSRAWDKDGTLNMNCLYENGIKIKCEDIKKEPEKEILFEAVDPKVCAEREKNCKGTNPMYGHATTEISTVGCQCINNKLIDCTDNQCSEITSEKRALICSFLEYRCADPRTDQSVINYYGVKCNCAGGVIVSCSEDICG